MLINREWKHSFESSPSNSVTSLISLWDLMFDDEGRSWFESYSLDSVDDNGEPLSPDIGCHLEHDLICFNKNLYQSNTTQNATDNIQNNKKPLDTVKFDSEFEKYTNEWLFGTFGIDISIPFYSPSSRPERYNAPESVTESGFNKKGVFLKFDKNAAIPYGDLRTFTINSISMNNSWGQSIKVREGTFTEPTYFSTFTPPKVGPYDDTLNPTQLREIGFDIWLKGKNTQFVKDNEIDENLEAYNNICVDPLSAYGKMLIIRAISKDADTFTRAAGLPINTKTAYAGLINSSFNFSAIKELLENTYVWIRAPFFADYVNPNSYNQNLNKESRVVHRDLILSEKGDFNEYNESIIADYTEEVEDESEAGETIVDKNTDWINTLPYISRTAPTKDFIKPDFVNSSNLSQILDDDNWFNDYDITGIPIPSSMSRLGVSEEESASDLLDNLFCPFIYWNTEYTEAFEKPNNADYKYFDSFFSNGRVPVFTKKFGNIYADGRIFSPTIDEIWTAYKELVCGRKDNTDDIEIALPKGTGDRVLTNSHLIDYNNASHSWSFKAYYNNSNGIETSSNKIGDPLNFRLGSYNSEGEFTPTRVTDFINHNNTIDYTIFSSIKNLNNSLRNVLTASSTASNKKNIDFDSRKDFFYLGKPYNEMPTTASSEYTRTGVEYKSKPGNDPTNSSTTNFNNFENYTFGPRPEPYSLRELEAMSKGNRYNIDTLAIWLKKNVAINSKVTFRYSNSTGSTSYSNEAKSGLYQFHKDYNGKFSDNTQFIQNKSDTEKGFLQFDDNSKFSTHYTLRKNFARSRINFTDQSKIDSSQVYLAADGTWRYIFEKPRTQIVDTTR